VEAGTADTGNVSACVNKWPKVAPESPAAGTERVIFNVLIAVRATEPHDSSVAQWLGRLSLAGRLSLMYA